MLMGFPGFCLSLVVSLPSRLLFLVFFCFNQLNGTIEREMVVNRRPMAALGQRPTSKTRNTRNETTIFVHEEPWMRVLRSLRKMLDSILRKLTNKSG